MDAAVVVFISSVCQGVGCAILDAHLDTFTVLDVEGRAFGIGERQTTELYRSFERAFHIELSVSTAARETIDDLVGGAFADIIALYQLDVRR